MTREVAINLIKKTNCRYAELTVDVLSRYGNTVYPNEKVIVSNLETQVQTDYIGKAYCVFDSIKDFKKNSVFGIKEAREHYTNYCFGNISRIDYIY